jgi:hypothetical protein
MCDVLTRYGNSNVKQQQQLHLVGILVPLSQNWKITIISDCLVSQLCTAVVAVRSMMFPIRFSSKFYFFIVCSHARVACSR